MSTPACVYLPLEPVQSRYTHDLCNEKDGWMTMTLRNARKWRAFHYVNPGVGGSRTDVKTGAVLDAYTRSVYSVAQCARVCRMIDDGLLKNGDVLYLQDFWTPGLEAILYCMELCKVKLNIFAMVHAQSVDQYDFTYPMRDWMRPIELGYARAMRGLFVASSIHKEQLQLAGVTTPIHVVSLPYDHKTAGKKYAVPGGDMAKLDQVIYSSRIDSEKQPEFMVEVAGKFLAERPDWKWVVTTSAAKLRSYNNPRAVTLLRQMAKRNKRFIIKEGLTKQQYHDELAVSRIQFNCSLQDYVSWTLIEAAHHCCMPVYPNFRSFPEALPPYCLYKAFNPISALSRLRQAADMRTFESIRASCHDQVIESTSRGRQMIANRITAADTGEVNVWNAL